MASHQFLIMAFLSASATDVNAWRGRASSLPRPRFFFFVFFFPQAKAGANCRIVQRASGLARSVHVTWGFSCPAASFGARQVMLDGGTGGTSLWT